MEATPIQLGQNRFRIAGVCMQLFISLLFIFCSLVMIKQIHHLIYADINIERKNIARIMSGIGDDQIKDILKQVPMVTEMVTVMAPLFPSNQAGGDIFRELNGRKGLNIVATQYSIDEDIARFYGLRIKEGADNFNLKEGEYLINETLAKQLGDPDPIGKTLSLNSEMKGIIKGIIYDYYYQPPTDPVDALYFVKQWQTGVFEDRKTQNFTVAFKYTGDFATCQAAIEKAFVNIEAPIRGLEKYTLLDGETVYNSYLVSEFNLLKMLNILTFISLLIALFGVYALILQECERQRKNIAIRKVYGAQVKDILMMFFKRYMMQVMIAAAFAFPIGLKSSTLSWNKTLTFPSPPADL